ncbi:hypothetical protein LIER_10192 [Lithospermum erythrorhizon]|uniref:Uncharacterized protein n=1 Tax=Lithospermum erythrorhizon TaxID=34254 RepID=A0AAV3PK28_LITER
MPFTARLNDVPIPTEFILPQFTQYIGRTFKAQQGSHRLGISKGIGDKISRKDPIPPPPQKRVGSLRSIQLAATHGRPDTPASHHF